MIPRLCIDANIIARRDGKCYHQTFDTIHRSKKYAIIHVTFLNCFPSIRVKEVLAVEDSQIIELYWQRDETAIKETDIAYGRKLYVLADRIVDSHEDAEESVSDTYMKTWSVIPPQRPNYFYAFLAKICRNFALGKLDWNNAAKRKADVVSLTAEMELCIPDRRQEEQLEAEEIGKLLTLFLNAISRESRLIFMRRYWYGDSIEEIAVRYDISESKVKTQLHRTRTKLREYLAKEGIAV